MPPAALDFAAPAHVLAVAVRSGEVRAPVAGKMLRHQLRTMNTNRALSVPPELWSKRAAEVHAEFAARGEQVPKNDYPEALHCDHVYGLRDEAFARLLTVEGWLQELQRLSIVVAVTARENYSLQQVERRGADGPGKYAEAGVDLVDAASVSEL